MSFTRTTLLALTAAVAIGSAMASTTSAFAWHGGGHHGGHHIGHHKWHGYKHAHWPRYRHYRPYYYAAPVVYRARPVYAAAPNQCSCLSKAYTPEGQVVFSDNCTKESAMAPVAGVPQQQGQVDAPQNFAGKTFQDFQNSQRQ